MEELKKEIKKHRKEFKQVKLALTHEVRHQHSQQEKKPTKVIPFKYSYYHFQNTSSSSSSKRFLVKNLEKDITKQVKKDEPKHSERES